MKFCYINSRGEKIDFSNHPYLFQFGDLLNYSWSYEEIQQNSVNFKKEIKEYTVSIAVLPDFKIPLDKRKAKFNEYIEHLLEVFEYDILNKTYGKLYADSGSYLECNIIASKKTDWNIGKPFMFNEFTVLANPVWITTKKYEFEKEEIKIFENDTAKVYDYEYPYQYLDDTGARTFINDHFMDCDFKIIAYGSFSEFFIDINGHIYQVSVSLDNSEYLEIDSKKKTIIKTDRMGNKINCYNLQNYNSNVFQKFPTGVNTLSYNNQFGLEITLYQERSEPRYI